MTTGPDGSNYRGSASTEALPLVVIGGGFAGVAAAVRLAELGEAPLLLESRPFVGGRTRSFQHEPAGEIIDNGQHLMMGCYNETFALLEALGTRDLVEIQPGLSVEFRDRDGGADRLRAVTPLWSPVDIAAGMFALEGISLREKLSLLRVALAVRQDPPGADETVEGFLDRLGQSLRVRERLWYPLAVATLNTPPSIASARLFHQVLRLGFLGGRKESSLAFATVGLSELIAPIDDFLQNHGGRMSTGSTVTGIEPLVDRYLIHLKDRPSIECRGLVATIPPRSLGRILPEGVLSESLTDNTAFPSSPIVSLYLWYDRPLESIPPICAMIGTRVEWVFNRRRLSATPPEARYPGLLSCTISAAYEATVASGADLVDAIDKELRGAFPELRGVRLMESLPIKEKLATFLATPDVERLRPPAATTLPGVFLAGDWTDTGLPATIEGAVRSGRHAAELLAGYRS